MHLSAFYTNLNLHEQTKNVLELSLHLSLQYYDEDDRIFLRPYSNIIVNFLKLGNLKKCITYVEKYNKCLGKVLSIESKTYQDSIVFLDILKQHNIDLIKGKEAFKNQETVRKIIEELVKRFVTNYVHADYEMSLNVNNDK